MRTQLIAAAALLGLMAAGPVAPTSAAEPKGAGAYSKAEADKHTYLDPTKASPDFAVQGEYVGEVDANGKKSKVAAQVSSQGGGAFLAAFYPGGLPGDGSDGKARFEAAGKAKDEAMTEVTFAPAGGAGYSATWSGGTLKGKTDAGASFELKRIERKSPTLGATPPAGAVVLFDGKNADAWDMPHVDDRGLLGAGAKTKQKFKNFTLHAEFLLPFKPFGREQDRANSGIYIQDRYEVQVLDSFGEKPTFNGTGSIYRQTPPDVNMCLPPLQWQTYDIEFTSPTFEGGKKTKNAVATVKLNGVAVHDHREITAKTGAGKPEGAEPGPIQLQGHGNPVFYRNIWIVEKP
jgi:hypothetical protein